MEVIVNVIKQMDLEGFRCLSNFNMLKKRRDDIIHAIRNSNHRWKMDDGKTVYRLNVLFIGQTGTGKSTTINCLTESDYMQTDDVACCTKEMNSVDFELSDDCKLCFCDMPGIGENVVSDTQYHEWYKDMYMHSDCVVYMLRVDKRDYSLDLEEFKKLRNPSEKKLIIGLNCVDKTPPINRSYNFSLSHEQKKILDRKLKDVSNLFGVPQCNIIPFSAAENYNIVQLQQIISETLLINLRVSF